MTASNENRGSLRDAQLKAIAERISSASDTGCSDADAQLVDDRKVLLEFVRELASQLKAVRRLADNSVHRISVEDLVAALEQTEE